MANSHSGDTMTDRFIRVLETFTPTRTFQTTSEIGRRAGLPSSSAHRIVNSLVAAGLLERDSQRRIRIGMRLWELATRSSPALRLRQSALPFMERVQARVRHHTQLAILEQDEALFLERLSGTSSGPNIARIAGRLPLHASSSGLVLLAYGPRDLQNRILQSSLQPVTKETVTDPVALDRMLTRIRTVGYSVAPGYVDRVSTGVAVPIRAETGTVAAALSVVLPREESTHLALAELQRAACSISDALKSRLASHSTAT